MITPYWASAVPGTFLIWKVLKTTLEMKFAQNLTLTMLGKLCAVLGTYLIWQVPTTTRKCP